MTTPNKTDRVEVVKILIIAVVSFLVGFGLVIFFFKPGSISLPEEDTSSSSPPSAQLAGDEGPPPDKGQGGGYAPSTYAPTQGAEEDTPSNVEQRSEGDAPPEVPPGRTPSGVMLDGSGFYLKCWDESGSELPGDSCDKLPVFEKRFSTRLYVVDKCKQKHSLEKTKGKLSVGVEVDFALGSLSFWNGASSDLENAALIAKCLRTELVGLPTYGFDHKYSKYRIFFTVLFGDTPKPTVSKPKSGAGKLVNVIKDRVRVRKEPVSGEIIGHISSDSKVRLLDKKDGWCRVVTPNDNEGWMTCEALSK